MKRSVAGGLPRLARTPLEYAVARSTLAHNEVPEEPPFDTDLHFEFGEGALESPLPRSDLSQEEVPSDEELDFDMVLPFRQTHQGHYRELSEALGAFGAVPNRDRPGQADQGRPTVG